VLCSVGFYGALKVFGVRSAVLAFPIANRLFDALLRLRFDAQLEECVCLVQPERLEGLNEEATFSSWLSRNARKAHRSYTPALFHTTIIYRVLHRLHKTKHSSLWSPQYQSTHGLGRSLVRLVFHSAYTFRDSYAYHDDKDYGSEYWVQLQSNHAKPLARPSGGGGCDGGRLYGQDIVKDEIVRMLCCSSNLWPCY
jgi:hypothetical protein